MILTLRIENFDQLDNGGQIMFTVDQRGASIGRKNSMDWALPDPSRIISGHHFDIQFTDNTYWLIDVSMNGTFLYGQRHRLDGAYKIQNGDRFVVGHYIIVAQMDEAYAPLPSAPSAAMEGVTDPWGQSSVDDDPWSFASAFDEPVNPHGKARAGNAFDDIGQSFVPLQRPQNPALPREVEQAPRVPPVPQPHPDSQPAAPSGPHAQPQFSQPHYQAPAGHGPENHGPENHGSEHHGPNSPGPESYGAEHQPPLSPAAPDNSAILQAFCEGVGLQLSDISQLDAEHLARELGKTVRVVTQETMRMLRDRANVKQFTRGGERTMRSATGNNPLKFMPDEDQALEALFFTPREGFIAGADGVKNALADIRAHQIAVFAALQPALANVLEGLSPEEIEDSADEGKLFTPGSKRGRSWDKFVARWDEKAKRGDHGMLDAFLAAFAQAYRDAISKSDPS